MATFMLISGLLSSGVLICAIVLGFQGSGSHLMVALAGALLAVAHHSLIFGIFTGSGKDTRELTEDLSLDSDFVKRTKAFKRTVFPPALYAIMFVLMVVFLGGAVSVYPGKIWGWAHGLMALYATFYNIKTFLLEWRAVKENSLILKSVNQTAANKLETVTLDQPTDHMEWGQHVFALGKFSCFLGWNTWLVYLYLRWIMGMLSVSVVPFIFVSGIFLVGGYYLRFRYSSYRPDKLAQGPA